ncbi:hypothetical protein GTP45_16835 [Pseudoduganella sp. FT55W]|uniref:WD40-like Beta Propeller Repeat n=1 Tax=Duganella rivi TaxID=2666083 RepID=A0A7X4KCS0_9BURK|nr:carboxypeptidase-like regulatory domain-containing protein [Duganella rivi]MYM68485.1 hypothetical protein [Duganella rivi]
MQTQKVARGVLVASLLGACSAALAVPDPIVNIIPLPNSNTPANPSVSNDGRYIAYRVGVGGFINIYVRDTVTGQDVQANLRVTDGSPVNAACDSPVMSGDGRYVAFGCRATEMGAVTTANVGYFVYDRIANRTELVPDLGSDIPLVLAFTGLSKDGRYLVFRTANTTTRAWKIHVRDLVNKTTTTTTAQYAGVPGESRMYISDDGRLITYTGRFDVNQTPVELLVFDRTTGITEIQSLRPNGGRGLYGIRDVSASDDGMTVAFVSNDNQLVTPAGPNALAIYVRNRRSGVTELMDRNLTTNLYMNALSGNGRYVAYANITVKVYDRWTKMTRSIPAPGVSSSTYPRMSSDGRYVVFNCARTAAAGGGQCMGYVDMGVAPDVKLSTKQLALTEGGIAGTYTAVLTQAPTSDVKVKVATSSQLALARTELTFTPLNWSTPQVISVQAVQDGVAEGLHTANLTHTVTSADVYYSVIPSMSVSAAISDAVVPTIVLPQEATWDKPELPLTGVASPGATVLLTAVNRDTGWLTSASIVADSQGNWSYTLTGLTSGVFDLDAQADGIKSAVKTVTVTLPTN